MQIKVRSEPDGKACVWIVDPSANDGGGETVDDSTRYLEEGQEIVLTATDVHEASGIAIGDVTGPAEPPAEEPASTPPAEEATDGEPPEPGETPEPADSPPAE